MQILNYEYFYDIVVKNGETGKALPMLKQYFPYEYAESVFTIDYRKLLEMGFEAVIFDIDNTLVHHGDSSTPKVDALFAGIQKMGLKTILLSNNNEERVQMFIENIDTLYVHLANKPDTAGYLKALELLGVEKEKVVMVGDQVFTDILGANRCGIASILVKFIRLPGKIKLGKRRRIEQLILKCYALHKPSQNRLGGICFTHRHHK